MTPKDTVPPSRTAQDLRHDPNYIQVFDGYGHELFVTKEQWRTGLLPGALKKDWENPSQLYGLIVMALRDGFFSDVLEAAAHLYHTDPVPSRGTTVYGIVLMKTGDLDHAEKVFRSYLSNHPEDGSVLTNLAKVYSERGETRKSEATLWHALEVDPNMENALAWHRAIYRERGGEAADARELERVAALPGSWRAQMWQARFALQSRDLAKAIELYRVGLNNAGRPAPTDLLVQMSGDLGNHGNLGEALALTEVEFVPKEHGLLVGNNLIKAHLDLGQIEAAAKILDQLYALQRPDWKEQLSFWDTAIAKARVAARPVDSHVPPASTMLCVEGPVWLKPLSPATVLFPRSGAPHALVSFLGGSATISGGSDQIRYQLADQPGRISRALPLFLAEQTYFRTGASVQVLIPWAQTQPGAFILSGTAWPDSDAAKYAGMVGSKSQYVVVTHLATSPEGSPDPWKLELRVVRTSDATCIGNLNASFTPSDMQDIFSGLVKGLREILDIWIPAVPSEFPTLYQVPQGQLADYLLRLEQLLATRCAGLETKDRGSLSGEREIIGGMLDLCVRCPSNVVVRLVLAQTLLAMKITRPDVVKSFKDKVYRMHAQDALAKAATEIVSELFNKAFS